MKKQLQQQLETIGNLTGLATNGKQAIANGQESFLSLDYTACYGGYQLVMIYVKNYSESNAFGGTHARVNAATMQARLTGIIQGLEFAKNLIPA